MSKMVKAFNFLDEKSSLGRFYKPKHLQSRIQFCYPKVEKDRSLDCFNFTLGSKLCTFALLIVSEWFVLH